MNTTTAGSQSEPATSQPAISQPTARVLTRSRQGRMLAGVASGIAAYVGVDAVVIRIAFVVLTLVGGLGIPLYLASWVLVPDERTRQSIASEFTSDVRAWRD
jgi:phage shock protein PspC (stress-responsive transcriptional regulator)